VRENLTHGSMRGRWKRSHGQLYTGTKGETLDTDKGLTYGPPRL
jgi:hypothetical protein